MSESLNSVNAGPWHVTVTVPNSDPADGRAITTSHVVIASSKDEARASALAEAAGPDADFNAATTVHARRLCG